MPIYPTNWKRYVYETNRQFDDLFTSAMKRVTYLIVKANALTVTGPNNLNIVFRPAPSVCALEFNNLDDPGYVDGNPSFKISATTTGIMQIISGLSNRDDFVWEQYETSRRFFYRREYSAAVTDGIIARRSYEDGTTYESPLTTTSITNTNMYMATNQLAGPGNVNYYRMSNINMGNNSFRYEGREPSFSGGPTVPDVPIPRIVAAEDSFQITYNVPTPSGLSFTSYGGARFTVTSDYVELCVRQTPTSTKGGYLYLSDSTLAFGYGTIGSSNPDCGFALTAGTQGQVYTRRKGAGWGTWGANPGQDYGDP